MDAETVARKSTELLSRKGFFYWRCSNLGNDIILVIKNGGFFRDKALAYTKELTAKGKLQTPPTVYTMDELHILCDQDNPRLIHEAKKLGEAQGQLLQTE